MSEAETIKELSSQYWSSTGQGAICVVQARSSITLQSGDNRHKHRTSPQADLLTSHPHRLGGFVLILRRSVHTYT